LSEETRRVCVEVGQYIRSERHQVAPEQVETKSRHSLVTRVDKHAEKMLVERLGQLLPEAGFIAEEGTSDRRGERFDWIVDPLDGTTNFIHGLYPHAVSVALREGDEIVVGVIYEVGADECFHTWKGGPALLNGKPIRVSATASIDDALIGTGFPYYDYSLLPNFIRSLEHFMVHSRGLRRPGSAATDLAYVACGRFDAFYEYSLNPWDVAAGILLVRQAGGTVHDFRGGTDYLFGKEIVACNAAMSEQMLATVRSFMYPAP